MTTPFAVPTPPPPPERTQQGGSTWVMPALVAIAVAIAALVIGGLVYWRAVPSAPMLPPVPGLVMASGPNGVTIEDAQPVFDQVAAEWLPGAQPIRIVMEVDWSSLPPDAKATTLPPGGVISAVYVAPWDAPFGKRQEAAALTMEVERGGGMMVNMQSQGWGAMPDLAPVGGAPKVTSAEALLIAEEEGGREYRASCPGVHNQVRVSWATTGPDAPYWAVTYNDARVPEKYGMLMRIDGESGLVLEAREISQPCGE